MGDIGGGFVSANATLFLIVVVVVVTTLKLTFSGDVCSSSIVTSSVSSFLPSLLSLLAIIPSSISTVSQIPISFLVPSFSLLGGESIFNSTEVSDAIDVMELSGSLFISCW